MFKWKSVHKGDRFEYKLVLDDNDNDSEVIGSVIVIENIVNGDITVKAECEEIGYKADKKLIKEIGIFDIYEGKGIPEGKKSYAVSFIIHNEEKTLKDKEIDKVMNKLIGSYKHQLNAELR